MAKTYRWEKLAPRIELIFLPNGIPLVIAPLHRATTFTQTITFRGGSDFETKETQGVFHYLEHLPFRGTRRYPSKAEIYGTIEGCGGFLGAHTAKEMTVYYAKVPAPYWKIALSVLADLVLHPLLTKEMVEAEREPILQEIAGSLPDPGWRLTRLWEEHLYGDQPAAWDIGGTEESVNSLSQEEILEIWEKFYTIPNVVISVAGAIPKNLITSIQRTFSVMRDGKQQEKPLPCRPHTPSMKISHLSSPELQQAFFGLGAKTFSHNDSRRFALMILENLLGEGGSSRLFLKLREELSLVYDVETGVRMFQDRGYLATLGGCNPANARRVFEAILQEYEMLKTLAPEEVEKAKGVLFGCLAMEWEDSAHLALSAAESFIKTQKKPDLSALISEYRAVTPEDVIGVSREIFTPENIFGVIISPHKRCPIRLSW